MGQSASTPLQVGSHVLVAIINAQMEMAAALPDSEAIMHILANHGMELTAATSASIGVRDGNELYFPVNEGATAGWADRRFPLDSTLTGQCLLSGELTCVPDLETHSLSTSSTANAAGIRSTLIVPLRHRDQTVAALSLVAPEPDAFSDTDILVTQLLVGLAGSALVHAQAYGELSEAKDEAELARAESAEFASMIAHELGSPIAAIQHASEVLGLEPLSPQQKRAQGLIDLETKALRRLVGDLRAASAQERGSFDLHLEVVPLAALLNEARDFAVTAPGNHPVTLEPGPDVNILVDPGRIAQVLRNLITNAAKYTPPGTAISIRAREDNDRVWIEVSDDGPGIDPEDARFIFAKFVRGRQNAGTKVSGLGLGLYLSKLIVQAHGGTLTLESCPGEGATFAFSVQVVR
jgi:signal transduction histidine kinase